MSEKREREKCRKEEGERERERKRLNIIYYFCLHPSEQLVLYMRTNCSQMVKINPFPPPNVAKF